MFVYEVLKVKKLDNAFKISYLCTIFLISMVYETIVLFI